MVDHRGVVAGVLDGIDQVVLRHLRAVFDVGPLHGEVHRRLHTVQVVEAALDLGRARSAAHARQLQIGRRHNGNYTPRGYIVKAV